MIKFGKSELNARLDYLYSISRYKNSDVSKMFTSLRTAISNYFERGEDFNYQAYKTFKRVVLDALYRNIQCDRMDLFPPQNTNFPRGYSDITELFQSEVFEEIMEISNLEFNNAFYVETVTDTGNSSSGQQTTTTITHNRKIESWTPQISSNIVAEFNALVALEKYCMYSYEHLSLVFIFEELGKVWQPYTKEKRDLAKLCYISRKWDWFEQFFNAGIYEPSYIAEIRE